MNTRGCMSVCRNQGPGERLGALVEAIVEKYYPGGLRAISAPMAKAAMRRTKDVSPPSPEERKARDEAVLRWWRAQPEGGRAVVHVCRQFRICYETARTIMRRAGIGAEQMGSHRTTAEQRAAILADWQGSDPATRTYVAVAKRHRVSDQTVWRIVMGVGRGKQ